MFPYGGIMPTCGIYGIFNVIDGRVYIGSTNNTVLRWASHRSDLRSNTHGNRLLQAAWNLHKEASFEFRVLERCPEDMLIVREDSWMGYYRSLDRVYGYNLVNAAQTVYTVDALSAISAGRTGIKTQPWSEESKKHMARVGEKNGRFGKPVSDETRRKISQANKGRRPTEEVRARMRGPRDLNDEVRKRLSEAASGANNPNYGKHRQHTEETKRRISQTSKGRSHSAAHGQHISEAFARKRALRLAGGAGASAKPISAVVSV